MTNEAENAAKEISEKLRKLKDETAKEITEGTSENWKLLFEPIRGLIDIAIIRLDILSPIQSAITSATAERDKEIAFLEETVARYAGNTQLAEKDKRIARLEALLQEVHDHLMPDYQGVRATNILAPEDAGIRDLCERIGYGAVMDSAARQWWLKDDCGAQTTSACAGVARKMDERIIKALEGE